MCYIEVVEVIEVKVSEVLQLSICNCPPINKLPIKRLQMKYLTHAEPIEELIECWQILFGRRFNEEVPGLDLVVHGAWCGYAIAQGPLPTLLILLRYVA